MRCEPPDTRFYADLKDLNAAFLDLITDRALVWHESLFGLDLAVLGALRTLSAAEIEFIAATPCPLAGFADLPSPNRLSDSGIDLRSADDRWLESAKLFAAELIMYLWHTAKQDRLTATLCLGPTRARAMTLADMSFREVQDCAVSAVHGLKARLGRHPRFWPDMIRVARCGDVELRSLSQVAVIPVLVGEDFAESSGR